MLSRYYDIIIFTIITNINSCLGGIYKYVGKYKTVCVFVVWLGAYYIIFFKYKLLFVLFIKVKENNQILYKFTFTKMYNNKNIIVSKITLFQSNFSMY